MAFNQRALGIATPPQDNSIGVGTYRILICALVLLALILRAIGLFWGLPDGEGGYSLHPDEGNNTAPALKMLERGSLNPEFFNYGSLYTYLLLGALTFLDAVGIDVDKRTAILAGRCISSAFGTLTVPIVAAMGRDLFGARAGIACAFFCAIAPGLILHSGFATVDVTAGFFTTATLFLTLRYASKGRLHLVVAAGVCAGFAAATKYPSGLVCLAPLWAIWANPVKGLKARHSGYLLFGCSVSFFLGCPFALIDVLTFWEHASYELFDHSLRGHGRLFANTGNGLVFLVGTNLVYLLGPIPLVLAVVGVFRSVSSRPQSLFPVLAFFIPMVVLLSVIDLRFMRYAIPLAPVLLIGVGALFQHSGTSWPRKTSIVSLALLSLAPVFVQSFGLLSLSPQEQTQRLLQGPQGEGDCILQPAHFVFSEAPLWATVESTENGYRCRGEQGSYSMGRRLRPESLTEVQPDWVLMSELWYARHCLADPLGQQLFFAELKEGYKLHANLNSVPTWSRWVFLNPNPPPDWLYPFLEQRVYQRALIQSQAPQ